MLTGALAVNSLRMKEGGTFVCDESAQDIKLEEGDSELPVSIFGESYWRECPPGSSSVNDGC